MADAGGAAPKRVGSRPGGGERSGTVRLCIGNLPYSMTDEGLEEVFAPHGELASARVIIDRDTGRSRGFGFVEYGNDDEGKAAMQPMDGQEVDGLSLRVNEAHERERR
jgi:cold-inducible RNA-binding protein